VRLVHCADIKAAASTRVPNNQENCLDASNNSIIDTTTTVFGLRAGHTVDITFGVSLVQFALPKETNQPFGPAQDITDSFKIDDLVTVAIDDKVVVPEAKHGSYKYRIDGNSFSFARYQLTSYKISQDEEYNAFPTHSLTISTKPNMPQNVLLNVAVLITQSQL
jgi:hypothetical protein